MKNLLLSYNASLCHVQNYFDECEEAYKIFDIKCQLLKYFNYMKMYRNRDIFDHFKIFSVINLIWFYWHKLSINCQWYFLCINLTLFKSNGKVYVVSICCSKHWKNCFNNKLFLLCTESMKNKRMTHLKCKLIKIFSF